MSLTQQRVSGGALAYRKSDDVAALLTRATAFQRLGHLAEAKVGYKKILKKRPNHFDALHMLGVCEHLLGDSPAALRYLKHALLLEPQSAAVRLVLGIVLSALQRRDEALVCFDQLIESLPDFADAHVKRGSLLLDARQFAEAIASFDNALAIDAKNLEALSSKARALHELGKFPDAIACYERVLAVKPADSRALVNRGAAFKELNQLENAIADFDMALAIEADLIVGWINRGDALVALGRLDDALASFDKAITINPEVMEGWLGRSKALMRARKPADALAACQRAHAIRPDSATVLVQLGNCLSLRGDTEAALSNIDRALAIKPDDEVAVSSKIFYLDFSESGDFASHQAARSEWWHRIGAKIAKEHPPRHHNDFDPNRRIVLGYVSSEFRSHSAAYSVRPILKNHDRSRFEVVCYSDSVIRDGVTTSFQDLSDRWRDTTQLTDDQMADRIRADKVDILVDLGRARLRVFARKPAPLQVSAWGHATGTGIPMIDYMFADPVLVPATVRHLFAEEIWDLPCAIMLEPPPNGLRCTEPPVKGNGYVTYGIFNRLSKCSDGAFAAWARILRADMTSRLLVKDHPLDDAATCRILLDKFSAHGIASDRISLMGATPREDHLAAYRHVDICLDPFPHGGGASTWEALHMGVPVVAKLGNAITKRAAGALLFAAGLSDWVATDDDQYVDTALRATPDSLETIRRELPVRIDERCGPLSYTMAVDAAYQAMWKKRCGEI